MTGSREPVATDKGAIAQWLVAFRVVPIIRAEERNDDVSELLGEVWWDCLRIDGRHLWYT